jgi:hypothetical protein
VLFYEDTGDEGQESGSVPQGDQTGSDNPGTQD